MGGMVWPKYHVTIVAQLGGGQLELGRWPCFRPAAGLPCFNVVFVLEGNFPEVLFPDAPLSPDRREHAWYSQWERGMKRCR